MNPQEQLDPSIVALTKAIGHQESGGDYNKIGDNGHSKGAYQWNSNTPLKEGEIPKNFALYASDVGADGSDFSPANQDRVAYKTVEKWGKQGLTPAQISSKWNSGNPDAYKTAKPGYNADQGVHYDVGNYVNSVAKYYDQYKNQPAQNDNTDLTKDKIIQNPNQTTPNSNMTPQNTPGTGIGGFINKITSPFVDLAAIPVQAGVAGYNALTGSNIKDPFAQGVPGLGNGQNVVNPASDILGKAKSALDVGETTATAAGVGGLLKLAGIGSGTAPVIKNAIKNFMPEVKEGQSLDEYLSTNPKSPGQVVEALTQQALKKETSIVDKAVLQQEIDRLLPTAIKEAGGKVPFSKLYPIAAKSAGILGGLLKGGLGLLGAGTLINGAEGLYNKFTK